MNMLQTIVPKSDQLNADDLIGRTMTIKVTEVRFKVGDEQPVLIHFEGDNGKPYKVCKSMRRVLVQAWGADANKYVGRSMTLIRDPKVLWAGQAIGGIRISHLSDIDGDLTMALTATRGSRKPYTVKPLGAQASAEVTPADKMISEYEQCATRAAFDALEKRRADAWKTTPPAQKTALKAAADACQARLANPQPQPQQKTIAEASYDEMTAKQALKECADAATTHEVYDLIKRDYQATGREMPVSIQATRDEHLEFLKQH